MRKVLGAEYLDRGPELNQRQLQLRIGNGEIHSTHTANPNPSGHFAVEVYDWEEMIANLDAQGVTYSPPQRSGVQRRTLHLYPRPGRK